MTVKFPAEWEPQDGVLLAWPHAATDWGPVLQRVEPVFIRLVQEISDQQRVLLVTEDAPQLEKKLRARFIDLNRVTLVQQPLNDTWCRDFGPLTVLTDSGPRLQNFNFNGWGGKFPAERDNAVTEALHRQGLLQGALDSHLLVLEGGSIESDGCGTLLTTSRCLLNPNRNPGWSRAKIEDTLCRILGARRILWLEHGHLVGDDTDAHIDTLARLAPKDTIVHVACDDATDEHFLPLSRMAEELNAFRTAANKPYRLLPLPWPQACLDEQGRRLPATYANFLIINEAVLVPTYGVPQDNAALAVIGEAFPHRRIIGINCSDIIRQGGSLHCLTMQLPQGVLP